MADDWTPVSLGRGSNKARQPQGGVARWLNCYLEEIGESGKTQYVAVAINGLVEFATVTGGSIIRRMLPLIEEDVVVVVAARLVFRVTSSGGATVSLGGIAADGFVTMAHNRKTPNKQIAIVCDGLWYILEGNTLTQGIDADLPPPLCVVEIDGYFIFLIVDGRWFLAGPNDSGVDPLDFAEAEASADNNVMAAVRGRTLLIMGSRSVEFWDPNGDATFPFSRTAAINVGCYAGATVANLLVTKGGIARDVVIFAATDQESAYAGIMALEGYEPKVISTPEVDELIRKEPDKDNLIGFAWTENAHPFYAIKGTSFTKVWDGKTGDWHDRESFNVKYWNPRCSAHLNGLTLFGHHSSSVIYRSDSDAFDEAGDPIIMRLQPPPIHNWPNSFRLGGVAADFVMGVGRSTGDEANDNPEVLFDYSKDGGVNFGAQRRYQLGRTAQRDGRVITRGLGRVNHNGITVRYTCSAKVVRTLQQLAITIS